jgi:hypothetical protein
MAIFKYTLPSGATFVVEAPSGTTQAQSDYWFYSQVASGSLVGYTPGQTLSSLETQLVKFGLSRLDRGTAGVDTTTILAIVLGSPVVAPVPNLLNVPLTLPIDAADLALTPTTTGVGPLSAQQIQAINAQIQNLVAEPEVFGVGDYNLTVPALEQAGYLKPGTSNYADPACVLGTPSVWTGKNGITSLTGLLTDKNVQAQVQTEVLQNNYNALSSSGAIQTSAVSAGAALIGQVYTSTGLSTLTPATLLAGTAALTGNLNSLVAEAFKGAPNIGSLLSNPVENISTIASGAVNSITQGLSNLPGQVLTSANNLVTGTLNSLTGQANSLVNNALSQATGIVSGLTNSVNGAVGGLLSNASQFGAPVTALWAQGSGVLGTVLGSTQGLVGTAIGSAQEYATSALGSLTNLASGALGSIQGQASALLGQLGGSLDVFGKMSSFSIDFSLFSSDALVSATKVAPGFSNTVNRQTVDAAVTRILGNGKIPPPSFEFPSISSLAAALDISAAQAKLNELVGQGQQVFTQVQQAGTTLQNTVSRLGQA